ncbi:nuclear transport factor 2 family protein [Terrimonas sp. NA20]|uniref:Nuclear transport factor 2 family protein n=1 Tax=Terrimonas ginsenosidimutans TaxID=2908004 RepID=A0ABS9KVD6_9BACT|nr:nuclear transport factor 2 family protein [Terrimonas ginsenosidimutans]MCG2616312.1 nuclear transport factor 2 family protein [Terrimonas ginsenosidimutans]
MPVEQTRTIAEVLHHHLSAFGSNDLEAILEDYSEESVILTKDGAVVGLANIRTFFEHFFQLIPTGSSFEMIRQELSGPVAYIAWSSESPTASIPMGSDTFIIEKGMIRYHTVADHRILPSR